MPGAPLPGASQSPGHGPDARPRQPRAAARLTCVMPTLQSAVVVADGVQVVQEVQRVAGGQAGRLLPGRPGARGRWGAGASLGHVGGHVEAGERELHQRGQLVPPLAQLAEPLQVDDEDVGQGPQAQLYHALLQGLAVRTLPRVVLSQLERQPPGRERPPPAPPRRTGADPPVPARAETLRGTCSSLV